MTWLAILSVSIIAQSAASIFNRVALKDAPRDTWGYAALSQILTGILLFAYASFQGFVMPPLLELWPWFLFVIFGNVAGNIFQFEALKTAEAGPFTILTSGRILIAMVAAALLLGETLGGTRVVGALIMLGAIAVAFTHHAHFEYRPWMVPAVCYALVSGLIFIGDARIVSESDVVSYMAIQFLLPGLVTVLLRPRITNDIGHIVMSKQFLPLLAYSALYGLMAVTLWLAFQSGGAASQIAPLRQSAVILTVVLGVLFLRERAYIVQKIAAALLAVLAVYLITLK